MLHSLTLFVLIYLPPTKEKRRKRRKGGKNYILGKGFLLLHLFPFFFLFIYLFIYLFTFF